MTPESRAYFMGVTDTCLAIVLITLLVYLS